MAVELFANVPSTQVSSGGTDAPASGAVETWTVASSAGFPAADSDGTPPTQFHVGDPAEYSEMIAVTNVAGTTWTVTRGAEGSTPVHHASGFTIMQVTTAGFLNSVFGRQPSGDASGATDSANLNADITTSGMAYLAAGTWYLNATVGPLATNQWVICAPGVFINWLGTGDCFRFVDTSTYTTRNPQVGGGITGFPVIDGTGAGAGSTGVHAGDILQLRVDVAVQNFTGAGDWGVLFDNQNYWTEQMTARIHVSNCASMAGFNCGGASTSQGSFDRGDITIYVAQQAAQGGVTFQNGAYIQGGRLRIFGNVSSSNSVLSNAVLTLTGSAPGGHVASNSGLSYCELDINVESDLGLTYAAQTIHFGSTSNGIANCNGNISFGAGFGFAQSNVTTISSQFTFGGPVTGDATLSQQTIPNRLSVSGEAFFFSPVFLGTQGSAPPHSTSGGIFYVDNTGHLHYIGTAGTDTTLAGP